MSTTAVPPTQRPTDAPTTVDPARRWGVRVDDRIIVDQVTYREASDAFDQHRPDVRRYGGCITLGQYLPSLDESGRFEWRRIFSYMRGKPRP